MFRFLLISFSVFFLAACGSDPLPAQCDPDRRCASDPNPTCGADGEWYECESVMTCWGISEAPDSDVCDEAPDPTCEPVTCTLWCDNGFRTDSRGCEVCICNEPETGCALNNLAPCPVPYELDEDGCEYCPEECPGLLEECPDDCRGTDENGCQTCDCEPACPPVDFDACADGSDCRVITDRDGCEYCQCEGENQCDRLFCDNYCANGYVIENGCPTCECNQPCDVDICDVDCPRQVDPATSCESGCDCLQNSCPDIACAQICANGFRRDANGCQTCECRGTACDVDEQCGLDEHCVTSPWDPVTDAPMGECVALERCSQALTCEDGGPCGFYYRTDCCPPLTTCADDQLECPAVCLLEYGDLP